MNAERGQRGISSWGRGCLVLVGLAVLSAIIIGRLGRSDGVTSAPRVGVIRLEGEIDSARDFLEELRKLEEDRRVRALVVRIDSPGGGVAATQEIFDGLRRYSARGERPLVASFGGLATSGGYYVGCAAEKIVCEPGSLTGSIGVLLSFSDASELLRKLGVRVEVVKSGARKDFGGFWRALTDDEREMLDGIVADAHAQFTAAVAEARGLSPEQVQELADGRIFTGRQALAAGLVDSLGFEKDAIAVAAGLAGLPEDTPAISRARRETGWFELLRRLAEDVRPPGARGPRLEYR
jgi:protease-4